MPVVRGKKREFQPPPPCSVTKQDTVTPTKNLFKPPTSLKRLKDAETYAGTSSSRTKSIPVSVIPVIASSSEKLHEPISLFKNNGTGSLHNEKSFIDHFRSLGEFFRGSIGNRKHFADILKEFHQTAELELVEAYRLDSQLKENSKLPISHTPMGKKIYENHLASSALFSTTTKRDRSPEVQVAKTIDDMPQSFEFVNASPGRKKFIMDDGSYIPNTTTNTPITFPIEMMKASIPEEAEVIPPDDCFNGTVELSTDAEDDYMNNSVDVVSSPTLGTVNIDELPLKEYVAPTTSVTALVKKFELQKLNDRGSAYSENKDYDRVFKPNVTGSSSSSTVTAPAVGPTQKNENAHLMENAMDITVDSLVVVSNDPNTNQDLTQCTMEETNVFVALKETALPNNELEFTVAKNDQTFVLGAVVGNKSSATKHESEILVESCDVQSLITTPRPPQSFKNNNQTYVCENKLSTIKISETVKLSESDMAPGVISGSNAPTFNKVNNNKTFVRGSKLDSVKLSGSGSGNEQSPISIVNKTYVANKFQVHDAVKKSSSVSENVFSDLLLPSASKPLSKLSTSSSSASSGGSMKSAVSQPSLAKVYLGIKMGAKNGVVTGSAGSICEKQNLMDKERRRKEKEEEADRRKQELDRRKADLQKKKNEEWKRKAEKMKEDEKKTSAMKFGSVQTTKGKLFPSVVPTFSKSTKPNLFTKGPAAHAGVVGELNHKMLGTRSIIAGEPVRLRLPVPEVSLDETYKTASDEQSVLDVTDIDPDNNYEITRYEDIDEECKHRENKAIPTWARSDNTYPSLFKQIPTLKNNLNFFPVIKKYKLYPFVTK